MGKLIEYLSLGEIISKNHRVEVGPYLRRQLNGMSPGAYDQYTHVILVESTVYGVPDAQVCGWLSDATGDDWEHVPLLANPGEDTPYETVLDSLRKDTFELE